MQINDYFSKGLCSNYGNNRMPPQYSPDLRNVRIENGVTIPRKGFRSVVESTSGTRVRGLASNNGNLYAMANSKFRLADLSTNAYSDIGNLPNDNRAFPLTYGKYTIVLTEDQPYVYDGSALSAVSTYSAGTAPRFGAVFANFTWIAGGSTFKNVLYVSRPITAANQERCYDWTGTGSDQIVCKSNILALVPTLDRLFIFQEGTIEWINRSSYTTIGGVTTFYANPLAKGEEVASPAAAVAAGDKLFFLTKSKKIKSVNYVLGVDQVEIGELSDDPKTWITAFMDSLNDDQSQSFGFYDSDAKQVKFFVRSGSGAFNDTVIIWDLVAQTFLVDDSKFFSCAARHSSATYCGAYLNASVFQDDYGTDDDGQPVSGYRKGAPLAGWKHGEYKVWMGAITTGTVNGSTSITKRLVVDGDSVDQSTISKNVAPLSGTIGFAPIGTAPIAGPLGTDVRRNFVKDRTDGYCNVPWRYFAADYSWSGISNDFSLETIQTKEKATNYREPNLES